MSKRLFDFIFAFLGIIILSPVFLVISLGILISDGKPVFFRQTRIGKNEKPFQIFKFRTMVNNAEKMGLSLTVGEKDPRILKVGYYLRKYKLDELPQLFNVFFGEMSLVGPRPEVPKYVALYNSEQKNVFKVRPGITDHASIAYRNENELLKNVTDPEKFYIENIMQKKLELNLEYIKNNSLSSDIRIILKTLKVL